MHVQMNAIDASEIVKPAVVAEPNIVSMNGQKREIERIQIDELPKHLDGEIQKINQAIKPNKKEGMFLAAGAVAAIFVFIAGLFPLMGLSVGVMLGSMAAGIFAYIGSIMGYSSEKILKGKYDVKIQNLLACQSDLKNEEFRSFAKTFGEALSFDELLQVHDLYQFQKKNQEQFDSMKLGLKCRINQFV